jgi:hypothetical protein
MKCEMALDTLIDELRAQKMEEYAQMALNAEKEMATIEDELLGRTRQQPE